MARKSSLPGWLWIVGGAAVYYFWPASAPATSSTLSAAAQPYMTQIMAAQATFLNGSQTQAQYTIAAQGILAKAVVDPTVTPSDMSILHGVAGA